MSTMKSVIAKFRKELRTTYQAQKNIMDVTDKYLTQLENAEAGGGSEVSVTQIQSTGTKIATITVDSVGTDIYAPKASVTQTVASGTEIAEVDGTKIYIPEAGSVSVTCDGVKTIKQLLDELYPLIDVNKLTPSSKLILDRTSGNDGIIIYNIIFYTNDIIQFTRINANSTSPYLSCTKIAIINNSGSAIHDSTPTGSTSGDNTVLTSGYKYTIIY